jgi:hypothetical protein
LRGKFFQVGDELTVIVHVVGNISECVNTQLLQDAFLRDQESVLK